MCSRLAYRNDDNHTWEGAPHDLFVYLLMFCHAAVQLIQSGFIHSYGHQSWNKYNKWHDSKA